MTLTAPAPTLSTAAADDEQARPRRVGIAARVGQLVRYASVSLISTAVGTTVLGTPVATRAVTPGWANVVATSVGTVPSFELNRRWVWGRRGARSATREVGPFVALSFAGLALSTAAVSVAGHLAASLGTTGRTALVEAANVGAFGSLWVVQFLLVDRVLFTPPAPTAQSSRQ